MGVPGTPPGVRGPLTLPGRVPQHVLFKGRVPGVGKAGIAQLGEPGLEVRPLFG